MHRTEVASSEKVLELQSRIRSEGLSAVASELKINRATLSKLARGLPVSPSTLRAVGATALRSSPKVRDADEFDVSPERLRPPSSGYGQLYNWDLAAIRGARNDQLIGKFERPSDLAKAMRTDDALFTARQN